MGRSKWLFVYYKCYFIFYDNNNNDYCNGINDIDDKKKNDKYWKSLLMISYY